MKNKSFLIVITLFMIVIVSAFGLSQETADSQNLVITEEDSSTVQLNEFGINGGINIDIRTGLKTEFVADNSITKNLFFMVQRGSSRNNTIPKIGRPISEEKLKNAKTIADVIESYPNNWIKDYNSVKIVATIDGKDVEAVGPNDQLTTEQKEIFKHATNVLINVHYQKENHENLVQNRQMNVALIVTPKNEAHFKDGYEKMIAYFKNNSIDKIEEKQFRYMPQPTISFVIKKDGSVSSVELTETSRDDEIDDLLISLVKGMPNWNAAVNSEGDAVEQEFVLMIGQDGC